MTRKINCFTCVTYTFHPLLIPNYRKCHVKNLILLYIYPPPIKVCKWNVNTSQALVRNFLLINNFATWFLVLQRLLLHFVCVFCGGDWVVILNPFQKIENAHTMEWEPLQYQRSGCKWYCYSNSILAYCCIRNHSCFSFYHL
jgi:hypothetical protein